MTLVVVIFLGAGVVLVVSAIGVGGQDVPLKDTFQALITGQLPTTTSEGPPPGVVVPPGATWKPGSSAVQSAQFPFQQGAPLL